MPTKISPPLLRDLRIKMQQALNPLFKSLNLELKIGKMTYTSANARCTIEIATVSENGIAMTREWQDYKNFGDHLGLKPEWLGKEFTFRPARGPSERYIITGLSARRGRMPVITKNVENNEVMFFAVNTILKCFSEPARV